MFGKRYFARHYFGHHYFGSPDSAIPVQNPDNIGGGGNSLWDFSEITEAHERIEHRKRASRDELHRLIVEAFAGPVAPTVELLEQPASAPVVEFDSAAALALVQAELRARGLQAHISRIEGQIARYEAEARARIIRQQQDNDTLMVLLLAA